MKHGKKTQTANTGLEIAVIGMAGRFPGSEDISSFWANLMDGSEAVTFFSEQELLDAGIHSSKVSQPAYIKAKNILFGKEFFDAAFFDYLPEEATIMDPQMRLFHECAWHAMEDAAIDTNTYPGLIGLFAGAGSNFIWEASTFMLGGNSSIDAFTASQLRRRDFMPTLVSYKLKLRGPSVFVFSACSTALVGVHLACRSLLTGDCQVALAGGVTLTSSTKKGIIYREGLINSPDGHCRPFDLHAQGTFGSEGVGVVVLKRLKNALADGDHIWAVIKGSAINNDGDRKVGYSAPSVDGQAEAIRMALKMSRVAPASIGYIEAHGTATPLGDPVEFEALVQAFGKEPGKQCVLGALKSNIGHSDTAAGVAGLIKVALALYYKKIPPTLHYQETNPKIDMENSPFYVNHKVLDWQSQSGPLRAGVSSFGIGGTNSHIIMEEGPSREPSSKSRSQQLLLLSAKSFDALDRMSHKMLVYLEENPSINLADTAYTLQMGRQAFSRRRMLVCQNDKEAAKILSEAGSPLIKSATIPRGTPKVVFMYSGQGAQYVNMGRQLYEEEELFRVEMDRCFDILKSITNKNFKEVLYPLSSDTSGEDPSRAINRTDNAQPLLFAFEYALTRLLAQWGIVPDMMIGHSIGEYTAACVAGSLFLEEALKLVTRRGELMQEMDPGSMLSVPLSEEELLPLLGNKLSIAAVNGLGLCVASGPIEAVSQLHEQLKKQGHNSRLLHTSHAFHSEMMSPMLETFKREFQGINIKEPVIPFISNITGQPVSHKEISHAGYWARQIRETVRFHEGVSGLLKAKNTVFIEVGPGKSLATFLRQHPNKQKGHNVIQTVRHPQETEGDLRYLLDKLGTLWLYGVNPDWKGFYYSENRLKLSLPNYSFEKTPYSADANLGVLMSSIIGQGPAMVRREDPAEWFYALSWKRSYLEPGKNIDPSAINGWLIMEDAGGLGKCLTEKLRSRGCRVINIKKGSQYNVLSDSCYELSPHMPDDFQKLLDTLLKKGFVPEKIIHLWSMDRENPELPLLERVAAAQKTGFYSLLNLAKALGKQQITSPIDLIIISSGLHQVTGSEQVSPEHMTLLGPVKVIPREYPHINCRSVDLVRSQENHDKSYSETLVKQVYHEIIHSSKDCIIAYRDLFRWVQSLEALPLEKPTHKPDFLEEGGVYLITGGLGGMGTTFAAYLARDFKANLILTGRSELGYEQTQAIKGLEELGARVVYVQGDIADYPDMEEKITAAESLLGYKLMGVIHTAGMADYAGIIQKRTFEENERVFAPKILGTMVVDRLCASRNPQFIIFCSSLSGQIGPFGQVGSSAANLFQDAFAHYRSVDPECKVFTLSIAWDAWRKVGMGVGAGNEGQGLMPDEGVDVLRRCLSYSRSGFSYLAVSPHEFNSLTECFRESKNSHFKETDSQIPRNQAKERPELTAQYVEPNTLVEKGLVVLWARFFGLDRIGINDDFFELGGDSLKAMNLCGLIHKELNAQVVLSDFFAHATVKGLAQFIKDSRDDDFSIIESIEKMEHYPLSSAQKRIFILQHLEPLNTTYNMPNILSMDQVIDREKFKQVMIRLIRRHESLRTSFFLEENEPRQKVWDEVEFTVEEYEMEDDSNHRKTEKIISQFVRPFDLSQAPLVRTGIICFPGKREVLLFDIHHIVSDGTSQRNLVHDFMRMYGGENLAPLKIQYKDYAAWQYYRNDKALELKKKYWMDLLSGQLPVLNLPIDFLRPPILEYQGKVIRFKVQEQVFVGIKDLASKKNATTFMVLLAAFNLMLSRLSGEEDIIVGSPVAGRGHPDLENLIGMFVNTLTMRNRPLGTKSFNVFLEEVKAGALKAFENQDYQFEDLVEDLLVERDLGRNPIFDVMFTRERIERSDSTPPGSADETQDKKKKFNYKNSTSKFDITLSVLETEDHLGFNFQYRTRLFKEESMVRFGEYFNNILVGITEKPENCLSQIDMISPREKQRLLIDFNNTTAEFPLLKTIPQYFLEITERVTHHVALCGLEPGIGELCVTYGELDRLSSKVAGFLVEEGVRPGEIVPILLNRSPGLVIAIIGIIKAGATYLPLDPTHPFERIEYMLKDSAASVLLTCRELIQEEEFGTRKTYKNLYMKDAVKFRPITPWDMKQPGAGDDALAYVIYTSGSTGRPKGVPVRQQSLINLVYTHKNEFPDDVIGRCTQLVSPGFDAMGLEIWPCLLRGGALYFACDETRLVPENLRDWIIQRQITYVFAPTIIAEQLLLLDWPESGLTLKVLGTGGDKLEIQTTGFLPFKFYDFYGPTEDTIVSTWGEVKLGTDFHERSGIGKPIGNHKIYILDKSGNLQPQGVTGELCIGGLGLAAGYLNRPELTGEKFVTNPFVPGERIYKTGDLARWQNNGNLDFLGRKDDQVKLRGYRIEPGEISSLLLRHEGVKDVVVILRKMESGDPILCAYYIPSDKENKADQEHLNQSSLFKNYLSNLLPSYMVPSFYVPMDRFPLTPNGKLNKKALPAPELSAVENYLPPTTELEKGLVGIWADLLKIPPENISMDSNFFMLGGHSLKATGLVTRIHREFNVRIPLKVIFNTPTIGQLASLIMEASKEIYEQIENLEEKAYYPLSYYQKRQLSMQQLDPKCSDFHMSGTQKLSGPESGENMEKSETINTGFKNWQNPMFQDSQFKKKAKTYWLEKLSADGKSLAYQGSINLIHEDKHGARYDSFIDLPLLDKLKDLANQQGTSLFMVLFSAYLLFLTRFNGRDEIACSINSKGSGHESLDETMDFLDNSLIVKISVQKDENFADITGRVEKEILNVFAYQEYPLELIFEELHADYPKIGNSFNMKHFKDDVFDMNLNNPVPGHVTENQAVKFNLEPYVIQYKNGIMVHWVYKKSLFPGESLEYMASEYIKLLEYFSHHPLSCYRDYRAESKKTVVKKKKFGKVKKNVRIDSEKIRIDAGSPIPMGAKGIQPVEKQEYYPLSPMQKRIYFLQQYDPDNIVYNMPLVIPMEKTQLTRLEVAFLCLIKRHESLRTSFTIIENQPVQKIHQPHEINFSIPSFDTPSPGPGGNIGIGAILAAHTRTFNLSKPPLLRVSVIKNGDKESLFIDMHHIVSDAVSQAVLMREMGLLYNDPQSKLPLLNIQYKDYCFWSNHRDQKNKLEGQEKYWLSNISDLPPVLNLPIDNIRPAEQSFRGAIVSFILNREETLVIIDLCEKRGTTLFMTCLSLLYILLSKLTGQEDIIVGIPVMGRRHPDLEKVIGMFVNTLVLRNFPSGQKKFSQFLSQVKDCSLESFENQDYPLDQLIEKLKIPRDRSRNPLIDVMFNFLNHMDYTGATSKGIDQRIGKHYQGTAKFDITLTGIDMGDQLAFELEYCSDLFKQATIDRFIKYFKQLLKSVSLDRDPLIAHMDMVPGFEKEKILKEFNCTQSDYPRELSIPEIFEHQVNRYPHRVALISPGQGRSVYALTYREFHSLSLRLAHFLVKKGVSPGTITGFVAERSIEMMIGIMGILRVGGIYMPIELDYPARRIDHMFKDSGAQFLVRNIEGDLPWARGIETIDISGFHNSKELGEGFSNCHLQYPQSKDLAYIIYTSGTTGTPKGNLTTHRNVVRVVKNTNYIDIVPEDRILQLSNYAFDGSVFDIFGSFLNGAALTLLNKEDVGSIEILSTIIRNRSITLFFLTTALFNTLVDVEPDCFKGVRKILFGGERVSLLHVKKALDFMGPGKLIHVYGPTETTVFATFYPVDVLESSLITVPIGGPLANTTIFIQDKYGNTQPLGVTGEILIGGDGLARGYLNQPELTAEKFITIEAQGLVSPYEYSGQLQQDNKLYRTGDLGRWLPDGSIEFVGRLDQQVKLRGFRIELGEIESQLLKNERIKEALVVALGGPGDQNQLCAYLVPENDKKGTSTELGDYLSQFLPDHMIPTFFLELDKLPLNANGKINIKALPKPISLGKKEIEVPVNDLEKRLVVMWREVLFGQNVGEEIAVGVTDNFFHLGGHSLKATVLAARIHREFGVRIPVKALFHSPTIRELAAWMMAEGKEDHEDILPLEEKEYYELSYHQKRLWFIKQLAPNSPAFHMPGTFELMDPIEPGHISWVVDQLVDRHESLRTGFTIVGEDPVQFIRKYVDSPFRFHDLSSYNQEEKKSEREKVYQDINIQPFEFDNPPLFRCALVKLGQGRWEFYYNIHHIVSDGWSQEILKKDFSLLYKNSGNLIGEDLSKTEIAYKEFANWQNRMLKSSRFKKKAHEFWLENLSGGVKPLLFTGSVDPAPGDKSGAGYTSFIQNSLAENIKNLARERGTSLFMVMFSAFILFLSRFTGQTEIACSVISAGRGHDAFNNVIGFFVNSLILKIRIQKDEGFIDFVRRVEKQILDVFEYQEYPLELIFQELAMKYPEIGVSFNMTNMDDDALKHELKKPESGHIAQSQDVKFDLEPYVKEYKNGIMVYWAYKKSLFTPESMEYMAGEYIKLLDYFTSHLQSSYLDYRVEGKKKVEKKKKFGRVNKNADN